MVRLIFGLKKDESCERYFKQLKWMPVKEKIEHKAINIIYKAIKKSKSIYLSEMFDVKKI